MTKVLKTLPTTLWSPMRGSKALNQEEPSSLGRRRKIFLVILSSLQQSVSFYAFSDRLTDIFVSCLTWSECELFSIEKTVELFSLDTFSFPCLKSFYIIDNWPKHCISFSLIGHQTIWSFRLQSFCTLTAQLIRFLASPTSTFLPFIPNCLVSETIEAEEASEQRESDKEDFSLGDTEDSKLFRKFLVTWENYFNKQRMENEKKQLSVKKKKSRMSKLI